MKELWLKVDKHVPHNLIESLVDMAAQTCNAVYLADWENVDAFKKAGLKIAGRNERCDIHVLEDADQTKITELKNAGKTIAAKFTVKSKEDEDKAVKAANNADYIIVRCTNWKVIPIENLIANVRGKSKLLAEVSNVEEAKLALETLELGVDGIIIATADPKELSKAAFTVKRQLPKLKLTSAKIVGVKQIGTGARVCIDTCDLMRAGEGLLVGCQSACLFLVEAEVHENPFVQPRPFRVNAGPVSLYALCSHEKTRYLSELKAGDEVMIVERDGKARLVNIGRVKIEWRPLLLIEAEHEGKVFKTITQNAETIRLVAEEDSIPVTELKPGDKVLVHLSESGRHFGTLVKDEMVVEL